MVSVIGIPGTGLFLGMSKKNYSEKRFLGSGLLLCLALGAFFVVYIWVSQEKAEEEKQSFNLEFRPREQGDPHGERSESSFQKRRTGSGAYRFVKAPEEPNGSAGLGSEARDPLLDAAIEHVDAGKPDEAVPLLEELLRKNPKNEQALVELGMIYLIDYKKPDEALGYLKQALEVNPENRVVVSEVIGLFEEKGQIDAGLDYLKGLYQNHPQSGGLALGVGQMLASHGRDKDAIPYLEVAAKLPDGDYFPTGELVEAYRRAGEFDKAIEAGKGSLIREEERLKSADEDSRAESQDRYTQAAIDHVQLLISLGRYSEAEETLEKIRVISPNDESLPGLIAQLERARSGKG